METRKILIAEADPDQARSLGELVAALGHEVAGIAKDAEAAIEAAGKIRFDLMLMDLDPGDNLVGIGTAQRMRKERPLPVVFITRVADDDFFGRAQALDPYGIILKPVTGAILSAVMATAFHRMDLERTIAASMEELRKARDAADAANRAKSDFLAAMSHELRTPLNSILGFSQLLMIAESGPLNERQLSYLADIRASGDHLLGMISDILDLSKIEAGKIEIVRKPFDASTMLERLVETMGPLAGKKRIRMAVTVEAGLGLLVADEARIRQVFFNLLSNAIKFTDEGRSVGLEAHGEGELAVITVWDEGIGIAQEDQRRIFDPFEQVRRTDGADQGTGLGLAITVRLVELHAGRIRLESELGHGSRFTVELPGRIPDRRSAPAPIQGERKLRRFAGISILVVEDNPVNRKLMMAMLGTAGHKASYASSGEEAVDLALRDHFDLVFMDINLPGIDGIEAMRRIRSAQPGEGEGLHRSGDGRTSFIALTAHAMKGDAERFIAEGMDEVITKPIELDRILKTLERFGLSVAKEAAPGFRIDPGSPVVPEIDRERGLLLLGGDRELYEEMLGLFADSYALFITAFRAALEGETTTEARRMVHGLKGASSNLGLREVEAMAKALESRLAAGERVSGADPSVSAMDDALSRTIASILRGPAP